MILILLKGAFIQDSPLSNIIETFGGLNPERIITRTAADFQLKPSAVDDSEFDCRTNRWTHRYRSSSRHLV